MSNVESESCEGLTLYVSSRSMGVIAAFTTMFLACTRNSSMLRSCYVRSKDDSPHLCLSF